MPKSIFIGQQSGVSLGFMEPHEPADHQDHAQALQSGLEADRQLATYQTERRGIGTNDRISDLARNEQLTQLAQEVLDWLDGQFERLKVWRMHAAEIEWSLVKSGQPQDAVSAIRQVEIRSRFERKSAEQRVELLRVAVGRHDAQDLEFLRAILLDNDLLSAIPEGIRERIGKICLELSDPPAFLRWQRLGRQLDGLEEVLNTASRYVKSDSNLSAGERAGRERDEATRRRMSAARSQL